MSNFCILRIKKLKTDGAVGGVISHHFRTRQTDNANPKNIESDYFYPPIQNKTDLNERQKMKRQAFAMYRNLLPEKVRKNGVRAVELLMTTSNLNEIKANNPNFDYKKFLIECGNWAAKKFGKENVFCGAQHFDETTPHISIVFVPKVNGKLNARHYFGGKEKMSQLQDEFFEEVGRKFELDRGIKHSKAKHQDIKKWYEEMKTAFQNTKDEIHKSFIEKELTPLQELIDLWEKSSPDYLKFCADEIEQNGVSSWAELVEKRKREEQAKQKRANLGHSGHSW